MKQIITILGLTIFIFISCSENKSRAKLKEVGETDNGNKTVIKKVEITTSEKPIIKNYSDIYDPTTSPKALDLYSLRDLEDNAHKKVVLISLSDGYPLSEHPDSLAIPNLENVNKESLLYFKLNSIYRKRFLSKTNISETDSVYIYDYSTDVLLTFPVRKLNVVAYLNENRDIEECPCKQYDYMIGFEVDKGYLKGLGKYYSEVLVFIGKKNPFTHGQMKPIVWRKIKTGRFPKVQIRPEDTAQFRRQLNSTPVQISPGDTATLNKYRCVEGDVYSYETDGMQYFVKEFFSDQDIYMRQFLVIDLKTKEIIFQMIFYHHESAQPSSLNSVDDKFIKQWTGKLFKNRPTVILGFESVSYCCERIIFLSSTEKDIYIKCDNRN
jgi:hypothetical protein